jgi:hypothetical protein
MRRAAVWAFAAGVVVAAGTVAGGSSTTYTHGYDVSWPQCSGKNGTGPAARSMPSAGARYVILGLTHGAGHTVNPCLGAQLSWARAKHVPVGAYLVPSYPTPSQLAAASTGPYGACGSDTTCRLGNDGARQATDALETMQQVGVPAPLVWVDVEFRHVHPWSKSHANNAHVIDGVLTGLRTAGMPYGVYTTSYMWSHIVGGLKVNAPNWLPAGSGKAADAKAMCGRTGSGGTTWIAQYTRQFDENLTCPSMDATPGHYGPLYRWRKTVLRQGSTGPAVTALQQALGMPAEVTGTYDDRTLAAVLALQASHLLPTDGVVDNDDWRALGAYTRYGAHGFLLSQVVAAVS